LKYAEDVREYFSEEEEELLRTAVEFEDYVCRRCGKCSCPLGVPIEEISACEGLFDRQMARGRADSAPGYALSERLKHWFGQKERGLARYAALEKNADDCTGCGKCLETCPCGVDIPYKMGLCAYKLGQKEIF